MTKATGWIGILIGGALLVALFAIGVPGGARAQEAPGSGTGVEVISGGDVVAEPVEAHPPASGAGEGTAGAKKPGKGGKGSGAQEPAAGGGKAGKKTVVSFEVPGVFDGLYTYMGDIQVSDISQDRPEDEILYPNALGLNSYGGARFRLAPVFNYKDLLVIHAEGDLMLYPFGDEPAGVDQSSDPRSHAGELSAWRHWFNPRQFYLEIKPSFNIFRIRQISSHWGMGILANDGSHDPAFGAVFGGDIVERFLFATKPFYKLPGEALKNTTLAVAADLVYDDITAKLYKGDLAWQAVVALRWEYKKQAAGFYFVYRNQKKDDGRKLEAYVFDWYLRLAVDFRSGLEGYIEGEAVFMSGETNFAYSVQHPDGYDVRQLGGAARIGLKWLDYLHFRIDGGVSSGDANLYDGAMRQLTMDPNFKVGLILFPEVLGWQSARAATVAGSPALTGVENPGIDMLPTNGGVSGAFFVNPIITGKPVKWLELKAGCVIARTTSYLVSAWEQKNRGHAAGYLGGSAKNKDLGVELDAAAWFTIPVKYVSMKLGVEGGYFWAGKYFTTADGKRMSDVWLVSGRVRFTY